ncbi:MAG: adenylate/guanylate cyclase domain-containing protein [Chloroflexaceae bacterium]|nr:adenylate/guanylate cyclase domain-containing protein [Chloroflexaceae bacterium]
MLQLLETLASYVPTLVIQRLHEYPTSLTRASDQQFPAAVLFADVSGFSTLADQLAQQGPKGAEELSSVLNQLFDELITFITAIGGDVVTFAGDAILAIWPAHTEDLATVSLRAAQCALALQIMLNDQRMIARVPLAVRMGIGVGDVRVMYLGGVYSRWLWLITGDPLLQVARAEQYAEPGQVVLSPQAWQLVQDSCLGQPIDQLPLSQRGRGVGGEGLSNNQERHHHNPSPVMLRSVITPAPLHLPAPLVPSPSIESALHSYIPGASLTRIGAGQGDWLAELRRVTVLFINLPDMQHIDMPLDQAQQMMCTIQTALYHYEASVNKISFDEKGITVVAVLGLPPLTHEDDPTRGIQAAMAIQRELQQLTYLSNIGVTTGWAFCGELGSDHRREYTILGDVVNLAARLMKAAEHDHSILCDDATYQTARSRMRFDTLEPITVKGKPDPIPVYRPCGETQEVSRTDHALVGRKDELTLIAVSLQSLVRDRKMRWW